MLVFYSLLFLLPFYKIKFAGKSFFAEESLSRDVTDSIKGFFIWLVFLSHFSSYIEGSNLLDTFAFKISWWLGQLIVACFFFYSGYGVCQAIGNRGYSYVKSLPKNRIFKTLLHFDLAVCLYIIINLCINKDMSAKDIVLGLIGWQGLGNSNWYIFVILAMYLITWLSFTLAKKNLKAALFITTLFSFGLIAFLHFTRYSYWYDTLLCYVLGMWVSAYKKEFLSIITKSNLVWGVCTSVLFILFSATYLLPSTTICYWIKSIFLAPLFCLLVTVLLTKFTVSNKLLINSGKYLFEIYILQRIPMIVLKHIGVYDLNHYLYFLLCVAITIVLSLIFRKILTKIDSVVFTFIRKR